MDANSPVPPNVWKLIDELLNDRIDAKGLRLLEASLVKDEVAREFFATYSQLHLDMVMDQHSEHVIRSFLASRVTSPALGDVSRNGYRAIKVASERESGESSARPKTERPHRLLSRSRWTWAIAAGLFVAACGIWWSGKNGNSTPMAIISGVEVDDNRVKLAIADVGTVYLEDSANFSIIGPKRARLSHGRIKMRVSEETGHGFVVETPYGEVTDHGTEFGLDVDQQGSGCVVVFEGSVDLSVPPEKKTSQSPPHIERLTGGEGLLFYDGGRLGRVNSISSGTSSTFLRDTHTLSAKQRVIANVTDNLQASDTKKYYDIVTGGLREDAPAYVDRPHDWNGTTSEGMPPYLVGADYVRTFNNDKGTRDIAVTVEFSQPVRLYVFLDRRVSVPDWLQRDFRQMNDFIGLDQGKTDQFDTNVREFGSGKFDRRFTVWLQDVPTPGVVQLGPNGKLMKDEGDSTHLAMYGIAATAIDHAAPLPSTKKDGVKPTKQRRAKSAK